VVVVEEEEEEEEEEGFFNALLGSGKTGRCKREGERTLGRRVTVGGCSREDFGRGAAK